MFGEDCELALAVVHAENGRMDPKLVSKPNRNGTRDHGCWQLNDAYYVSQYDCFKDTLTAYEIYKSWGGFHAWSAYNNGNYKKYYQ